MEIRILWSLVSLIQPAYNRQMVNLLLFLINMVTHSKIWDEYDVLY